MWALTDKQKPENQSILRESYMEKNTCWLRIISITVEHFCNLNAETALEWEPNFAHLIAEKPALPFYEAIIFNFYSTK